MNLIDRAGILEFHRRRTEEYGAGSEGSLGWPEPEAQRARFDILAEIGSLDGCSVLDVGCGHGDFGALLRSRYPGLRYLGIDHSEAFLEIADQRYRDEPDTIFYLGDFTSAQLPTADYVLASGALSYNVGGPDFLPRIIERLFAVCRVGFGFNLLRHVEDRDSALRAADPEAVVEHCGGFAERIVVREGYLANDFTVFLYRE